MLDDCGPREAAYLDHRERHAQNASHDAENRSVGLIEASGRLARGEPGAREGFRDALRNATNLSDDWENDTAALIGDVRYTENVTLTSPEVVMCAITARNPIMGQHANVTRADVPFALSLVDGAMARFAGIDPSSQESYLVALDAAESAARDLGVEPYAPVGVPNLAPLIDEIYCTAFECEE